MSWGQDHPSWLVSAESRALGRRVERLRHTWDDSAGRRIRTRYLDEHQRRAKAMGSRLREQQEALQRSDASAHEANETLKTAHDEAEQLAQQTQRGTEELASVQQYGDQARQAADRARSSLEAALQALSTAGQDCRRGTDQDYGQLLEAVQSGNYKSIRDLKLQALRQTIVVGVVHLLDNDLVAEGISEMLDLPPGTMEGVQLLMVLHPLLTDSVQRRVAAHAVRDLIDQVKEMDGEDR